MTSETTLLSVLESEFEGVDSMHSTQLLRYKTNIFEKKGVRNIRGIVCVRVEGNKN